MLGVTVVLVGMWVSAAPVPAAGTKDLIQKVVAAYGGEPALAKLKAVRQTGQVTSTMRKGAGGPVTRVFARDAKLRVEIAYPNEPTEVRIFDGAQGWRNGTAVQGPPLEAMRLQAARLDLPFLLFTRAAEVQDRGMTAWEGKKVRVLEVPVGQGWSLSAEIDPQTGHILRSVGRATSPMPMEFVTEYGDFKKTGGLLFGMKERTWAMGQLTGETTLERVELLSGPPTGVFAR